ncbi:MAG: ankyrin repeat domain-containing protein [Candidatus Berkiella sp.]
MFEPLFILLQKTYPNPNTALTTLKTWFKKKAVKPDDIQHLNATSTLSTQLLNAAAASGFTSVFSYLVTQGFSPFRALLPFGFNAFHHVVNLRHKEMAEVLLKAHPSLIHTQSRQGATALFLACQQGNLPLATWLVQQGASLNQGDIHGLTPMGVAFIGRHAELLAFLLKAGASPLLFEHAHNQNKLLWSFSQPPAHAHKIRCLNLLLAHGGGLHLSAIPDEIGDFLHVDRKAPADFLLIGEEKQADGLYKKRLFTTLASLEKYINHPNWRFEKASLARTCQHPLLKESAVAKALSGLLAQNPTEVAEPNTPDGVDVMVDPLNNRKGLAKDQLLIQFQQQLQIMQRCNQSILEIRIKNLPHSRLQALLHCAMQSVHAMTALAHHNEAALLAIQEQPVYFLAFTEFNALVQGISHILNHSTSLGASTLYTVLDNSLKDILKQDGEVLKDKYASLYNSLVDARALFLAKMTRCYLAQGKHDVAVNLSLESMTVNDQLLIDNDSLKFSAELTKAICLISTSEVFITQGWVSKALRHTTQAINLLNNSWYYDALVIKQVQQLANSLAERDKAPRSIDLIKQAIRYLKSLPSLHDAQGLEIQRYINELEAQHHQLQTRAYNARVDIAKQHLSETCDIIEDIENLSIYITPKIDVFSAHLQESYFSFIANNGSFRLQNNKQLVITQECLLSKKFPEQIAQLAKILAFKPVTPLEVVAAELADLHLEPTEETYGFKKPAGFTRIVPIESSSLPKNTLFVTMPESSEAFMPFYKLFRNQHTYYPVASIASKGLNKQGIKLGTALSHEQGKAPENIAVGRLKIEGTKRAKGRVEQTILAENGKQRKLYVFREVVDKKTEERKRYLY